MMSEEFKIEPAASGDPAPAPAPTPTVDYTDQLAQIVGDDGQPKYKDVNTALDALKHSQEYIKTLKTETDAEKAARIAAEAKVKSQEEIEALLTPTPKAEPTPEPSPEPQPEGLSLEDVEAYFAKKEATKVAQANVDAVSVAIREAYGAEAKEKYAEALASSGLDADTAVDLAKKAPDSLLKLMGVEKPKADPSAQSSVNTSILDETKPEKAPESVFGVTTHKQLTDIWLESKRRTNAKLGIE